MKSAMSSVIGISVLVVFLVGLVHSARKHSLSQSLLFFPIGIYRGVEILWHDDFADVEWPKRINSEEQIIYGFMVSGLDGAPLSAQIIQEQEKFNKRFLSYPSCVQTELKDFGDDVLQYNESMLADSLVYFSNNNSPLKSQETINIEKRILNSHSGKEFQLIVERTDEAFKKAKQQIVEKGIDIENLKTEMKSSMDFKLKIMRTTHNKLYAN